MGSLTLSGALITQLSLRRLNLIAVLLIILWTLSPLASQSSIQVLGSGRRLLRKDGFVTYFNTNGPPGFSSAIGAPLASLNALLTTSLMVPQNVDQSPMDLWDNVKIPDISRLPNITANPAGWFNLTTNDNASFSSLIGIPFYVKPTNGNMSFQMEISYLSLNCSNITVIEKYQDYDSKTFEGQGYFTGVSRNYTDSMTSGFVIALQYPSESLNTPWENIFESQNITYSAQTLLYQALDSGLIAWCPITTTYVESSVECIGSFCAVTAIRPSQLAHPSPNLTNLAFPEIFEPFSANLMTSLGGQSQLQNSVALENYVANSSFNTQAWNGDSEGFSLRLQQVINTYWYGSYNPVGIMGLFQMFNAIEFVAGQPSPIKTVNATTVVWQEIYVCNFGWLVALFTASLVMLCAAIIGLFLSLDIQGPELLGYCSTLFRDTPYSRHSLKSGSLLDGFARARKLGDLRVRLRDVEADKEVGYLAIAEGGEKRSRRLLRDRYYR